MKISSRITAMQESPIRKLVPIAEKAKKEGKKVYHLNIGQPDIETPKSFLESMRNFEQDVIKYSFSQGSPELIEAMIEYYKTYDMHFEEDDILITNGGSEALIFSMYGVADNGENILVPEPFYTNYNGFATPTGVSIKAISTFAENGFKLPEKEKIVSLIDDKTRAILLSNPGNPTGAVYSKEEVYMIAEIAKEHDLFIIADEVYREFIYDGLTYTSFGTIKEVEDKVIIIDSISKRYSACGARIGSIACKNKEFMKGILKLCQARLCVPTLEQIGATALYKTPQSYFDSVNKEYDHRRNIVFDYLEKMEGVSCIKPRGAFYVIATLPVENAEDFVIWMLEEFDDNNETVMFAPAEGFYSTEGYGRNQIRMAYILNEKDLIRAMQIFEKGLKAYMNR